uniref:Uncharacterized protein n=1 Tax=Aegilops tauschii subsp. strangulata TaxID=200361 RepID=A0A453IEY3_AEGTS
GPAHERRHGRTNAPILFFFTVTTWLQHRLTQPIQRRGIYTLAHTGPAATLGHARTNQPHTCSPFTWPAHTRS